MGKRELRNAPKNGKAIWKALMNQSHPNGLVQNVVQRKDWKRIPTTEARAIAYGAGILGKPLLRKRKRRRRARKKSRKWRRKMIDPKRKRRRGTKSMTIIANGE